ncbi:MAG: protein-methionine-sulfoxide reductase catalytic subunit MsrP [Gammaproteobacteria bacterium]|nr:protein-methionine-sulfoxide reductase catalytic subunit MsrP [Gammaproteobacteria bacterium]
MPKKIYRGIPEREVTDEKTYLARRILLKSLGLGALGYFTSNLLANSEGLGKKDWMAEKFRLINKSDVSDLFNPTPFKYVTSYNNFYEFGSDKSDPKKYAKNFITDPWSVAVKGECNKPGTFDLEDIIKPHQLEERIYRFRCVEAWSMVVPWVGFPLADFIKRFEPRSSAKYLRFETLYDPDQMPGQRTPFSAIQYPYVEGLRIDEAVNELAFLAVGLYGKLMPNQNGAPLRLVIPWKYGFKSIKSIVKVEFVRRQPETTWVNSNPREYGFYSNVNPEVDHPRWSQATERRLPSTIFSPNIRPTQIYNGYGPQVAHLYRGMNLKNFF